MAEGSDEAGSELGDMDVTGAGGSCENGKWDIVRKNKRKKGGNTHSDESNSEGERRERVVGNRQQEFMVVVKLAQEGASFGVWNPIRLTKSISKEIGEVMSAKVLRNGSMLIKCRDREQQGKAKTMSTVEGKKVECSLFSGRKLVRGVVTGIPVRISAEDVKGNITNARISDVKRMKANRNGIKEDSLSVLITFDEKSLPEKILIGYMCYYVRPYVPPPLRCFKCQRFGHVAAVCKGKQRCGRCGGDHEYGKCEEGAKLKCCNCGGEHSSAYRGCEVSKKAEEVQRVRVTQGVSYAEAAKTVSGGTQVTMENNKKSKEIVHNCVKLKEDTLIVSKREFVLFMAEIINCSAQTKSRNERIKIIVKSAEKYLDVKGMRWEHVKDILNDDVQQSQIWSGSS